MYRSASGVVPILLLTAVAELCAQQQEGSATAPKQPKEQSTAWTYAAPLLPTDPWYYSGFGSAVAVDGNTAVVTAFTSDFATAGSVYFFTNSGGSWNQQAKLYAFDGTVTDYFGSCVSISGNTAVVGAPRALVNGTIQGAAYVFVNNGGNWIQSQKLTASDGGVQFGVSVSVSGNWILVGSNGTDTAYLYENVGGTWMQQAELASPSSASSFGLSVALSGNTAVIAAPFSAAGGSVYVYTNNAGIWTLSATLDSPAGITGQFGNAVAIDGNTIAVGVPPNTYSPSTFLGAVIIYQLISGTWTQQAQLTGPSTQQGLGQFVALSGDYGLASPNGSAPYVFGDDTGSWLLEGTLPHGGMTGAISGSTALLGGQQDLAGFYGVAFLYQHPTAAQMSQTITFASLGDETYGAAPFAVSATASSALPVTFASMSPRVCSVSGNIVTINYVGQCTIEAVQTGNASYSAAPPVDQGFQVLLGTAVGQTMAFPALPNLPLNSPPFTLTAVASSGLPVSFTSLTPMVCQVSGTTVIPLATGQCSIEASQPGDASYLQAEFAVQVFQVMAASTAASQTVTFAPLPNLPLSSSPFTVTATASSGLPVSFFGMSPAICNLSGNTVTLVAAGQCTIQASQFGNGQYLPAASVIQSFAVLTTAPATQTITFGALSNRTYGAAPFTISATATSGLPVSLSSLTPAVCTILGNVVTLVTTGQCTIQATQAGNANYLPAPAVNQSFQVVQPAQSSQTITFGALPNRNYGAAPFTVSATASSGLPVSFSSLTPAVCWVSGNVVTLVTTGQCTIQATQAGNTNYLPASAVNQSFQVLQPVQSSQTITFGALSNKTYGAAPFTISATASSGLPVSFSTLTPAVCWVSGNVVTLVTTGQCTIQATQAGNLYYLPAPAVNQSFQVVQAAQSSQTISFAALPSVQWASPPFAVSATSSSGLPVTFSSLTPAVCSVLSAEVTLLSVGQCSIQATQSGNTAYLPATPVTQSFQVTPRQQTITVTLPATAAFSSQPVGFNASSTSGLQVTVTSSAPTVCGVSGTNVVMVAVGTCRLQATQAGNADWAAAVPVTAKIQITAESQTIEFAALQDRALGTAPFSVSATATSGLAVSFSVLPGNGSFSARQEACRVSGNTVTLMRAGECTIQATQPGNSEYSAAAPVTQSFAVSPAPQTITFTVPSSETLSAGIVRVSAAASSGLPVSFTSDTPSVCTVVRTVHVGQQSTALLKLIVAGTCDIEASQPGNADFQAAAAVTQSFQVTN